MRPTTHSPLPAIPGHLRRSPFTAIRRGSSGVIERRRVDEGATSAGEIMADGAILIDIQWNNWTHTLFPSPAHVKEYFQHYPGKLIHIKFLKQTEAVISADDLRSELKDYFEVFLEELPRWRSVKFWAPYVPRECFVGKIFLAARSLEHVVLEGPASFDIPATSHLMSQCWSNCLSLRTFELMSKTRDTVGSMIISPRNYLPLDNITALQLRNKLSIFECSEVLYRAQNLVECLFSNITGSDSVLSPIRCRSLEKMELAVNLDDFDSLNPVQFGSLFESVRAPKLHHLKMGNNHHWDDDHNSFMTFIKRSKCNLEALELDQIKITGPQLHDILFSSRSLRILKVHGSASQNPQPFTHSIMWDLTKSPANSSLLCPLLEMFSINDTAFKDLPDGMVSKMLVGRIGDLKMVWLRFNHLATVHQSIDVTKLRTIASNPRVLNAIVDDSTASLREWDHMVRELSRKPNVI
ncbi:hypothetical protein CVT25_015412 [Psilocybe cyanescens]|uniref:F-box domain-containing protein n=1 Tax=Psilocybe cyanescens TaxID=93625 RepID=A0A409WHF7_PSICY|nr:hypothetical protein CVT25_015412 [Psilocybe cyanescens]